MKGLRIVSVRGTYFNIELDGVPVTNATYTLAQAQEFLELYKKIYLSGQSSVQTEGWK